jgi:protein-disulfide isomerase
VLTVAEGITSAMRRIDADTKDAQKVGATGTPAFFVNGFFLSGAKPFEVFKEVIDKELADRKKV